MSVYTNACNFIEFCNTAYIFLSHSNQHLKPPAITYIRDSHSLMIPNKVHFKGALGVGFFLPNLCHMHVSLCHECQTRLTIEEECRCLYGTLLGKVTVILSFDLEETSLTCSWKSAQMLRTELLPYLYLNFKAQPPPNQTKWLDVCTCKPTEWVSLKPPSVAFLSISVVCCLLMSEEHFYILSAVVLYMWFLSTFGRWAQMQIISGSVLAWSSRKTHHAHNRRSLDTKNLLNVLIIHLFLKFLLWIL